jgi:hypothetical protein
MQASPRGDAGVISRRRHWLACTAFILTSSGELAHAESLPQTQSQAHEGPSWAAFPCGHAHYGVGVGLGQESGLRQSLDLSGGLAFGRTDSGVPWIVEASLVTGFRAYPTYTSLDVGKVVFWHADHSSFTGATVTVGPVLRVDPSVAPGLGASVRVYALMLQLGVRSIYSTAGSGDAQIEVTVGVGIL